MLYKPQSFVGYLIAIKTWTQISHVEVYRGNGTSWASRDGIGVGMYPTRFDGLVEVRRPYGFDVIAAERWFHTVDGQAYDLFGLMCFFLAVKRGYKDRMFCSEFALNLYRASGSTVLAESCAADHTSPSEFRQTTGLKTTWSG